MPDNIERLTRAINFLVEADQYAKLLRELTELIDGWSKRPMVYAGELEFLNAIVDVGVANREAFNKLVALVDQKRSLMPEVRRNTYQTNLMRERRERQRKAKELHELVTGRKISKAEMPKFASDLHKRWRKEREAYTQAKGDLSWAARNEAANAFWAEIDATLEKNLEDARAKRARH